MHAGAHTHTLTHSLTLTHTHMHARTHAHTHTHTHTLTHSHTHTHTHSHTLSHTHTHTQLPHTDKMETPSNSKHRFPAPFPRRKDAVNQCSESGRASDLFGIHFRYTHQRMRRRKNHRSRSTSRHFDMVLKSTSRPLCNRHIDTDLCIS